MNKTKNKNSKMFGDSVEKTSELIIRLDERMGAIDEKLEEISISIKRFEENYTSLDKLRLLENRVALLEKINYGLISFVLLTVISIMLKYTLNITI